MISEGAKIRTTFLKTCRISKVVIVVFVVIVISFALSGYQVVEKYLITWLLLLVSRFYNSPSNSFKCRIVCVG